MADKHEITSMILDEVSLVDDPANPEANVVIAKARQAPADGDRTEAVRAEIAKAIRDLSPTIIERVGAALPSDTEAADLAAEFVALADFDRDGVGCSGAIDGLVVDVGHGLFLIRWSWR